MAGSDNMPSDKVAEIQRLRRRRSIAIAVSLGVLALIFYAVSMVKMLS